MKHAHAVASWSPRAARRRPSGVDRLCEQLIQEAKVHGSDLGELAARVRGFRRRTLKPREADVLEWLNDLVVELAQVQTPAARLRMLRRFFERSYNLGASAPFEV